MANDDNFGTARGMLFGFLAGTVVGAIVALLYAPKSGKELRRDIKEKVGDLRDEVTENLKAARGKGVDFVNEGKRRSDQVITDAKVKAEHLLDDADKLLSMARERAADETSRVKAAFRTASQTPGTGSPKEG